MSRRMLVQKNFIFDKVENLQVPKFQIKKSISPSFQRYRVSQTRQNKENVVCQNQVVQKRVIQNPALKTKFSLNGCDQKYETDQQLIDLNTMIQYDGILEQQNNRTLINRVMAKVESQSNILCERDENSKQQQRPVSVHQRRIMEKISKSIVKTQEKEQPRIVSENNYVTVKKDENLSSSSGSSHNIWGDEEENGLSFFDLYHLRYDRCPNSEGRITQREIVNNIKGLLGYNLIIRNLGQYPWYTYGLASPQSLIPQQQIKDAFVIGQTQKDYLLKKYIRDRSNAIQNENLEDYYKQLKKKSEQIGRYDREMRFQNMRFEAKLRPKLREQRQTKYCGNSLCNELSSKYPMQLQNTQNITQQPFFVNQRVVSQRQVGSPEILMKRYLFQKIVTQQKGQI